MRTAAILLALLGGAWAAPKTVECVATSEQALQIARSRGKMILLTVIIDRDAENRAVVEEVFRDAAFRKIATEFVLLYANPDNHHGNIRVKGPKGEALTRCADCPNLECVHHMTLAQNYARAFFPDHEARTPVHFVLNAKEEVLATIMNGDFKTGFSHVPAKTVVTELKKLLDKHGKGLSEAEYDKMMRALSDATAARARDNTPLELAKLLEVVALDRDIDGVKQAKERVKEIDAKAAKELAKIEALITEKKWEDAIDALAKIGEDFPGTLTAAAAAAKRTEILGMREVKRLLQARDLYEAGMRFEALKKIEQAAKKFADCARRFPETKYGELAKAELMKLQPEGK